MISFSLTFNVVFSTYVEVILQMAYETTEQLCILHVCGGDPMQALQKELVKQYSPRRWR